MKPTEASTLHALLDDHAAKGDHEAIEEMGSRAMRRAAAAPNRSFQASVWAHVSSACAYRALAVRARLKGRVALALSHEGKSERDLETLYAMTRGRN